MARKFSVAAAQWTLAMQATGVPAKCMAMGTPSSSAMSPILWVCHTLYLAGLPFGRVIGWIGQVRDDHAVPFSLAFHQLWPHTALGLACLAVLAVAQPAAIPYALLIAGGPALSIPHYAQTLDFTCGPSSLIMAMKALKPEVAADRALELQLWREAT